MRSHRGVGGKEERDVTRTLVLELAASSKYNLLAPEMCFHYPLP